MREHTRARLFPAFSHLHAELFLFLTLLLLAPRLLIRVIRVILRLASFLHAYTRITLITHAQRLPDRIRSQPRSAGSVIHLIRPPTQMPKYIHTRCPRSQPRARRDRLAHTVAQPATHHTRTSSLVSSFLFPSASVALTWGRYIRGLNVSACCVLFCVSDVRK